MGSLERPGYPVVENEYPGDESKNFGRRQHLSWQSFNEEKASSHSSMCGN